MTACSSSESRHRRSGRGAVVRAGLLAMLALLFKVVLNIDIGETWRQISAANPKDLLVLLVGWRVIATMVARRRSRRA